MVEVFKTNVEHIVDAARLVALLLDRFPDSRINFDLDDCDKVLRIEGENIRVEKVPSVLESNGFTCAILN